MSEARPFYFHPGGCQIIGDCLVVPIENGEGESFITFMDVSDPKDIREVNPAARIARTYNDAGSVGVTNLTIAGKDFWLLCAYDNGGTDFYLSEDPFPGKFKVIFSTTLEQRELQSLSLVTDVANNVFAVGMDRTPAGRDMAVLYAVELTKKKVTYRGGSPFPDDRSLTTSSAAERTSVGAAESRSSPPPSSSGCSAPDGDMTPGATSMDSIPRKDLCVEPRAHEVA